MKKLIKISVVIIIVLLLSTVLFYYLVNSPAVQNWLVQQVASSLSEDLNTEVSIGEVKVRFFNRLEVNDLYIEDQQGDTLIYAQKLFTSVRRLQPMRGKIYLGQVELNKPKVNFYRMKGHEEFNYQFLLDALASKDDTDTSSKVIDLNFRELTFTKVDLDLVDSVNEKSLTIDVDRMFMTSRKLDMIAHQMELKSVSIDGLQLSYRDMRQDLVPFTDKYIEAKQNESVPGMLNAAGWDIKADDIRITNSNFTYDKDNRPYDNRGMDYAHLQVDSINMDLTGVHVVEDTIFTHINSFSAQEKCGFKVLDLTANAAIATTKMTFNDLLLETPNSLIHNYFSMEFDQLSDFGRFEDKVVMDGEFNGAAVSLQDINYFAKALSSIDHNTVKLSGSIRGTVKNLRGRDLQIDFGNNSSFNGDVTFLGLPKIEETFISLNVKELYTNLGEIRRFVPPAKIPATFNVLGQMRFSGHFDGFFNDFVADGRLNTAIGRINSDINLKVKPDGAEYSGNFSTYKLDLGKWMGNEELFGDLTVSTNIKGKGLKLSNLDAYADGEIQSITLKGYEYNNVTVDGDLSERRFNGAFSVQDSNLVMDFTGRFNLNDTLPVFDFVAHVDTANLQQLNLVDEAIGLHTNMTLNFTGNGLDNMNGKLDITHTNITRQDSAYSIDTLYLDSYDNNGSKMINLRSDIADGWMQGKFNFGDLPLVLKDMFSHYFINGYQPVPEDSLPDQDFVFHIDIDDTKNLTRLFSQDLTNISGGYINGFFASKDRNFLISSEIPSINLGGVKLEDIYVNSGTNEGRVTLQTQVDNIYLNDSLLSNNWHVDAGIIKDSVDFLITLEDTSSPNYLHLGGALESDLETFSLHLKESFVKLEGHTWTLDGQNYMAFDGTQLTVKDMRLLNGEDMLNVETNNVNEHTNLSVSFQDIRLERFIPKLEEVIGHKVSGTLNGDMSILNLLEQPALVSNVTIGNFSIDDDILGNVQTTASYLRRSDFVQTRIKVEGNNELMIAGKYYIADTVNQLDMVCTIDKFEAGYIEKFVSKFVSKVQGVATGKLNITGNLKEPIIAGDLKINNGQALVNYLNTTYRFEESNLKLTDGKIDLDQFTIIDQDNNTALASGILTHNHLRNFEMAIDVETDEFMMLNTGPSSANLFYGQVYAGGYVFIQGPFNMVEFYAAVETKPKTQFYIQVDDPKDVNKYSFYQFMNKDTLTKTTNDRFKFKNAGVRLNFDVAVTPDAEVNLLLSEEQGDVITGRGKGNIVLEMDEFYDMSMVGDYEITSGEYNFSLQNVISKKFEITKGSQIQWNGDPYDARLAVTAAYKLRAAPYDLIEDVLKEDRPLQQSKNRVPVLLYLKLNGSLSAPDISFDISVPESDPGIRSAVEAKLALIRTDQNELNKQVVGLLVLNRFLPVYPIGSGPNSDLVEGLNNTVSEFVSNQLSIYLTDWISRFITEVELDINYRDYQSELNSDPTNPTTETEFERRRELQLALTKSFFNDRVEIDIGGNFDFGSSGQTDANGDGTTNATNIAGDFEIRYNITPDGRIKVKVFRKGEYDIFQERNRNKTGIGIQYKREFDTVNELFSNIKKKRKERQEKRKAEKQQKPEEPAKTEEEQ